MNYASVVYLLVFQSLLGINGDDPQNVHARLRRAATVRENCNEGCPFFLIADLDQKSKRGDGESIKWITYLKKGILISSNNGFHIEWKDEEELSTALSSEFRAAEFSEMGWLDNKLYTGDDRTGIIYEIYNDGERHGLAPRHILGGHENNPKPFKIEWMCVKDNELLIGSHGTTRKKRDGSLDKSLQLVIFVGKNMRTLRSESWEHIYGKVRSALEVPDDGYVTHESVLWNPKNRKFLFFPRRVSDISFEETHDSFDAGNDKMVECDEFGDNCQVKRLGLSGFGKKGYSSVQFVPGSANTVVMALRTTETADQQKSHISVIDTQNGVLLCEEDVPDLTEGRKFEGLIFDNL